MSPVDKIARTAGAIYLTMVLAGPPSLMLLPNKLVVRGDATATANNVLNHPNLVRLWIMSGLWTHVVFISLGIVLYRLLSRVDRTWALAMLGLVLVSAAVGFINCLNTIAGILLFRGAEFLNAFDKLQRDALGMFFFQLHSEGIFINEMFWGLWLFPFGLLVFRSGFLPRFIGGWLMLNCIAWLALSPIALFWADYYSRAFQFTQPLLWGELAIMLWLLLKGVKLKDQAPIVAGV